LEEALTDEQIGALSLAGRILNRQRSEVRYAINQYCGDPMEDRKVNYTQETAHD
jgi:hypothetical protein